MKCWRITKSKRAASAFDGEGARLYGGRWNSPGTRIIYTSESQALAALELLANLESAAGLEAYVLIAAEIDEQLVAALDARTLPTGWRAHPASTALRAIGDEWVAKATSVALRVPSVIIPSEHNFLLNPAHRDFQRVRIGRPQPFALDPRVVRRR